MRIMIKLFINKLCQLLALPFAITCWLENYLSPHCETFFSLWAQAFSVLPGLPGVFMRRGFYSLTLDSCSLNCHIGFGTIFAHRSSIVEDNVYTGSYCSIGSAHLGKNCLIGSHASLLSGNSQHTRDDESGQWQAFSPQGMTQIKIAENVWVGEGAIVLANVGAGSLVAAGAVVNTNVKSNVVVAGNPARFVKNFSPPASQDLTETDKIPHNVPV